MPMNYQESIDYLYAQLPLFSRIGEAAYKKDLHNTLALCERLQQPHQKIKTIHIAGTNGKGSVSHMLASALQEAGYKTGLYTSPHLYDFRERIKINGEMISQDEVVSFTTQIKPWIEEIKPSFFEVTVAMAFDYFNRMQVDIAVIETGLGGRLDSTNVIHPQLSVITNIGWDHMNLLGNNLEQIAYEKAGIIKKDTPVVIGKMQAESWPVFEQMARIQTAPLLLATDHYQVRTHEWKNDCLEVEIEEQVEKKKFRFHLDLPGVYQLENIITACSAIEQLQKLGYAISIDQQINGLENVRRNTGLQGRWEQIAKQPAIFLDVAHNEDGIKKLLQQFQLTKHNKLHLVIGMVKDKEIEKVLALLPQSATYYFTQAQTPRALEASLLHKKAATVGLQGSHYENVNVAIQAARLAASPHDLIVVCGSLYLIGEVNRDNSY